MCRGAPLRLVSVVVVLVAAARADAQISYTWNNSPTDTAWSSPTAWTPNAPVGGPTTSDTATFGSSAATNSPTVGTGEVVSIGRAVFVNGTGIGQQWNLVGPSGDATNRLVLGGPADASSLTALRNTAAIDLSGGGTSTFSANLQVAPRTGGTAAVGVFLTGGTTLDVTGVLSSATASNALIVRLDGTSVLRLSGTNTINSAVNVGSSVGTAGARVEVNSDQAFGTGTLNVTGGGGGSVTLAAVGGSRTVAAAANFNLTTQFGTAATAANSLTFSAATTLGAVTTTRTLQSEIFNAAGTAAVRFTGPVGLRAAGQTTIDAIVQFTGNGRVEFTGDVTNGGGTGSAGIVVGSGNGATTAVRLASGNSSYSGRTEIRSGTLIVANNVPADGTNGALGSNNTAAIRIGESGTQAKGLVIDGSFTVARAVTVASANTAATTFGSVGAVTATFSGPITLGTNGSATAMPVNLSANAGGSTTFTGAIARATGFTGNVNLTKTNNGTVVFASTATTSGLDPLVTVSGGVLQVDNTLTTTRGASVNSGATLSGNGTVAGAVSVAGGGTVRGGSGTAATGQLTVGGLTVADGGRLQFAVAPTGNSAINLGGGVFDTATTADLVQIDLIPIGIPDAPTPNNNGGAGYTLLSNAAFGPNAPTAGTYTAATPGRFAFPSWVADWSLTVGPGGFVLNSFTPVPEPAGLTALAAVGLAGLWVRRRRGD
jgi:hypothetical protein